MDRQEGNSTASFGSGSNLTSNETMNMAMVGQTANSDQVSSVSESPAQSSEYSLNVRPRRGSARRGQDRSVRPRGTPNHDLPGIPSSDDEGRGRSTLSRSLPVNQLAVRSRSPNPGTSMIGQISSAKPSVQGTPERQIENGRKSGYSTPKSVKSQSKPSEAQMGAEARLNELLALHPSKCPSPGSMSQISQFPFLYPSPM